VTALGERFLAHHLAFHPVDGTFMGRRECDAHLPRADRAAGADEAIGIAALRALIPGSPEASVAERLDKRIASSELAHAAATLAQRPRFANPAWYTGEVAFGIMGLLLPQSAPVDVAAISARLAAIPDFLADGRARLSEARAAPAGWVARARQEAAVTARFLTSKLSNIEGAREDWQARSETAAAALAGFAASLDALADRDPACGEEYVNLVIREVHGLDHDADTLANAARNAFERLGAEIVEEASRFAPNREAREILGGLTAIHPEEDGVLGAYRHWHQRALAAAAETGLVTPAADYALDVRELSHVFQEAAPDLYFLAYRSPPAFHAGERSVYWVPSPGTDRAAYLREQNTAAIKIIHAVHHGSIGHHTQNAHARTATGLLARVGGTDCAAKIAFLSSGTMVEGWACYVQDLMVEADGFYSPAEMLLLKQFERRNAASVLVDINLHRGHWNVDEAARFYRDEAGFAAGRVHGEVTRISMFPGSRLMYWAGIEAIRALRRSWRGSTRAFHDTLIGFGHVPIAVAAAEMALDLA
jgi:hypothetical protein